jgi:dienelactone hydrolase
MQRPPAFHVPATLAAWMRRRREIRQTLWQLLGGTPPRPSPVRATVVSRREQASYVREDLLLNDGTGAKIPAVVLVPRAGAEPRPAILYQHSHWGEYEVGLDELFQPWPVRETPAVSLTRRGWVVLSIDARAFGARRGQGPGGPRERGRDEETSLAKACLWQGSSLWAMMVRDDLIALDYLASRPDVDTRRIGATGMSMGSTRTWWIAALDERVAVAACVACLTRAQALLARGAVARHGIYYFVPGFLCHFDTEAVVSLIAPRPLLTLTGDRDVGSPIEGVRAINRAVARVYGLYGRRSRFAGVVLRRTAHVYTPAMWRRVLAWFDRHLAPPAREPVTSPRRAGVTAGARR